MDVLTIQAGRPVELAFTGLCMSERERGEWEHWNRESGPLRAANPCEDCTVEFHQEQTQAGTCDGRPKGADPRHIRKGVKNKWADEDWAAKRRAQMSDAAAKRNRAGGRRKRKSKYEGQRCQEHPCKSQPVTTSRASGLMLCRKHQNLESYHRNKARYT